MLLLGCDGGAAAANLSQVWLVCAAGLVGASLPVKISQELRVTEIIRSPRGRGIR